MKSLVLMLALVVTGFSWAASPKYVFLFIGDGMSTPQRMTADEFSRAAGLGSLAMNALPFQATTRTCSATSLVTDSAAAATAIACGVKTYNGAVGVDHNKLPVDSCAKVAHAAGMKVGILTTVTLTHATPAGFYAHRRNRGEYYGIALDLANSGFEFFAGGGLSGRYDDTEAPEYATCGNAYDYAASKGYSIVTNREDFLALKPGCGKILTRFTDGTLPAAIDSGAAKYPTLAQLVTKAAEVLDGEQGFFIMAEGGRIDWAGHANDAATNLRDVLALDDAVKVALEFQLRHPDETLVVVTGDHETGGMSMGFAGTGYAFFTERLVHQKMSANRFFDRFKEGIEANPDMPFDALCALVVEAFGFKFEGDSAQDPMVLTESEVEELRKAFEHDRGFARAKVAETEAYDGEKRYLVDGVCKLIMSHKCGIGWSSGAHTAMPVLTTAKGCGAESFCGFIENTDIAKHLKSFFR